MSLLYPLVREKVKAIVCLGIDNQKIIDSFNPFVDIILETQSMKEAVMIAHKIADKNENVLLSPACASFDLFENYRRSRYAVQTSCQRIIKWIKC